MSKYYEFAIGERFARDWKRGFPPVVALLFTSAELSTVVADEEGDELTVVAQQSVASSLTQLSEMGLSPGYFQSVWQEYRGGARGYVEAYLYGLSAGERQIEIEKPERLNGMRTSEDRPSIDSLRQRFVSLSASDEIEWAVGLLKTYGPHPWNDRFVEPGDLLLPRIMAVSIPVLAKPGVLESSALGLFLEGARESFPEIAWMIEVYLMLKASSPEEIVTFTFASEFVKDVETARSVLTGCLESIADKVGLYHRTFAALTDGAGFVQRRLRRDSLRDAWTDVRNAASSQEKGRRLESFVEQLLTAIDGLLVIEKNLRTETEELDLVVRNNIARPFWIALGSPLILVECKNWSDSVGVSDARVLESKMRGRTRFAGVSLFVAPNGTTRPFSEHVSRIRRDGLHVAVIEGHDIEVLLEVEEFLPLQWIEDLIARQLPR